MKTEYILYIALGELQSLRKLYGEKERTEYCSANWSGGWMHCNKRTLKLIREGSYRRQKLLARLYERSSKRVAVFWMALFVIDAFIRWSTSEKIWLKINFLYCWTIREIFIFSFFLSSEKWCNFNICYNDFHDCRWFITVAVYNVVSSILAVFIQLSDIAPTRWKKIALLLSDGAAYFALSRLSISRRPAKSICAVINIVLRFFSFTLKSSMASRRSSSE